MKLPPSLEAILFDPTVGKLVLAIVGIAVMVGIRGVVTRTLGKRVEDTTARYRTRKLLQIVSYLAIVIVVATVFSDRLGGLTVAFGVAGAGVAIALQEVIVSVAGWVAVTFERPIGSAIASCSAGSRAT